MVLIKFLCCVGVVDVVDNQNFENKQSLLALVCSLETNGMQSAVNAPLPSQKAQIGQTLTFEKSNLICQFTSLCLIAPTVHLAHVLYREGGK